MKWNGIEERKKQTSNFYGAISLLVALMMKVDENGEEWSAIIALHTNKYVFLVN